MRHRKQRSLGIFCRSANQHPYFVFGIRLHRPQDNSGVTRIAVKGNGAAPGIRPTDDVDAIVEISTKADYYRLGEKLRKLGFTEDTSKGAPLCRWRSGELILDIMPTSDSVLGFGNAWYQAAHTHANRVELNSDLCIQLVSAPYFLITKLAAFDGRGQNDYQLSHDLEDIIAVVDGRPELLEEVSQAEKPLKDAIAKRFGELLQEQRFRQAIAGHLPPDGASQARLPRLVNILEQISQRSD